MQSKYAAVRYPYNMKRGSDSFPQGLKPECVWNLFGTTKVAPCYKAFTFRAIVFNFQGSRVWNGVPPEATNLQPRILHCVSG